MAPPEGAGQRTSTAEVSAGAFYGYGRRRPVYMTMEVTLIRVFVSSPEDLAADREIVKEAAEELNRTWCADSGVRLEVFSWKTAGFPDFGPDPQAVLNQQLREFDIYIGLMGHKFGSPTPRAGSGTEEEFRRAYKRWETDNWSCKLMFYFKEAPVAPSSIEPEQLRKVGAFQSDLRLLGCLYWTYSSASAELAGLVRRHLYDAVRNYGLTWGSRRTTPADSVARPHGLETQKGQLDYGADAEESLQEVQRALAIIGASMRQMGDEIRRAAEDVTSLRSSGALTASAAQQSARSVARAIIAMVAQVDLALPNLMQGWKAFRENVMLALGSAVAPETPNEKQELLQQAVLLRAGRSQLQEVRAAVGEMRIELRKLSNLGRDLWEAEGKANASLAALITEIDRELADLGQLEAAILAKLNVT